MKVNQHPPQKAKQQKATKNQWAKCIYFLLCFCNWFVSPWLYCPLYRSCNWQLILAVRCPIDEPHRWEPVGLRKSECASWIQIAWKSLKWFEAFGTIKATKLMWQRREGLSIKNQKIEIFQLFTLCISDSVTSPTSKSQSYMHSVSQQSQQPPSVVTENNNFKHSSALPLTPHNSLITDCLHQFCI